MGKKYWYYKYGSHYQIFNLEGTLFHATLYCKSNTQQHPAICCLSKARKISPIFSLKTFYSVNLLLHKSKRHFLNKLQILLIYRKKNIDIIFDQIIFDQIKFFQGAIVN